MEKKPQLKVMKCPSCGGELRYEKEGEPMECLYCGNMVMAQADVSSAVNQQASGIKIDGIKNPSSATAYVEKYIDEYDWDSFVYSRGIHIAELEQITEDMLVTCADDKRTWFLSIIAESTPYLKKLEGTDALLSQIIEEYSNDFVNAYALFDVYKHSVYALTVQKPLRIEKLDKYIEKAAKYGASVDELIEYKQIIQSVKDSSIPYNYKSIEDIPEIAEIISRKKAAELLKYSEMGIDAEKEYQEAVALKNEGDYKGAYEKFSTILDYKDTAELVKSVRDNYRFGEMLYCYGQYYCLKKSEAGGGLYRVEDDKLSAKPIIDNVATIVGSFVDKLYCLENGHLVMFDLIEQKKCTTDYRGLFSETFIYTDAAGNAFLSDSGILHKLNMATGELTSLNEKVDKVLCSSNIHYFAYSKNKETTSDATDNESVKETSTWVIDLATEESRKICDGKAEVCNLIDGRYLIYCKNAPDYDNKDLSVRDCPNKDLYVFDYETGDNTILEKNIYEYLDVIDGQIYYYVGSSRKKALMSVDVKKTKCIRIASNISSSVFELNGWLYFIRSSGYNTVLCRAKADGSQYSIITSDISSIVKIQNAYLYYIDSFDNLRCIRLDGSANEILCSHVSEILKLDEENVIYIAEDSSKIDSIYQYCFQSEILKKLVYDIEWASEEEEGKIYVKRKDIKDAQIREYMVINLPSCEIKPLFQTRVVQSSSQGCYVATCVYGSYDCPEVWTLRRFRDNVLAESLLGRMFIHTYYAISPTLVKWFGETNWFKKMWRGKLDRMVSDLKEQGFESTPYQDRNW